MNQQLKQLLNRVQKPGRYTGGEPGCIYKPSAELRFAFCFPDTYEVAMSYLGMKVLYEILNNMQDVWCERAFMPWVDMAAELKEQGIPLFALESSDPLTQFDMLGFTLQYELSYTNILAMLELSGVPLRTSERGEQYPLIVAGGPCATNPEPLAPFIDIIMLGEGERQLPQLCSLVLQAKKEKLSKNELLIKATEIEGIYVPSLYDVSYTEDGRINSITANDGAPAKVTKAFLQDFAEFEPQKQVVVPMVGAVHDRAMIEVLRGCVRGCRFCQAGFIYRPMRERPADMLNNSARGLCDSTGYEEVSLTSLSTSDHSQLEPLLDSLLSWTPQRHINLALPSLRVDNFSKTLVEKTTRVRKSGLTFAPEAGTQRLRDVINKNVTDQEIMRTCKLAFEAGYTSVKLYFMMGLPTETMEDIEGIAQTAQDVVDLFYSLPTKPKGKSVKVSISVACFVPKPVTPFQYCGQDSMENLKQKQTHLLRSVQSKKISVSYHDARTSFMEAVFARGDRRLADVLEAAYKAGCVFDGWDEHFKYSTWMQCFDTLGLDPYFYAGRTIEFDELTPWNHLDNKVSDEFLQSEYQKAMDASVTAPCNRACAGCGANSLVKGGVCFENSANIL